MSSRSRQDRFTAAVLFTYSRRDPISWLISWGQRLEKEENYIPSHVAIVSSYDPDKKGGYIWEATVGGVQRSPITKYISRRHVSYIAVPPLSVPQKEGICSWAHKFAGRGYGYLDLLVYFIDLLGHRLGLRRGWLTRRLNKPRHLVCSEFVGYCYGRGAHYRFRDNQGHWIRPSDLTPLDIWLEARRAGWELVRVS